jgi:hypothetical protein
LIQTPSQEVVGDDFELVWRVRFHAADSGRIPSRGPDMQIRMFGADPACIYRPVLGVLGDLLQDRFDIV